MEAIYYTPLDNLKVRCTLCPHECVIAPEHSGICKVRTNNNGKLTADIYGVAAAMQFDPIEKKPLYHFYPGKEILSLGGLGCNFHCSCCQNYEISQSGKKGFPRLQELTIEKILALAHSSPDNIGVAYTYNEPMVWFEFMFDIASEISKANLRNVVVSNGYVNREPLSQLLKYIDAFNIDLKGFDNAAHKKFTGGELKYVLQTLKAIVNAGKHLEITFLTVPGINDDPGLFEKMVHWIRTDLSAKIPLHISRYFPRYKSVAEPTPVALLDSLAVIAHKYLDFVYTGNVMKGDFQHTNCPKCGSVVIYREGYRIDRTGMNSKGLCNSCGYPIAIN